MTINEFAGKKYKTIVRKNGGVVRVLVRRASMLPNNASTFRVRQANGEILVQRWNRGWKTFVSFEDTSGDDVTYEYVGFTGGQQSNVVFSGMAYCDDF